MLFSYLHWCTFNRILMTPVKKPEYFNYLELYQPAFSKYLRMELSKTETILEREKEAHHFSPPNQ